MKAIVIDRYGLPDVLALREIDTPAPKDHEALVRVRAASLNPYDWHFMTGLPHIARPVFGLRRPKIKGIGADLAGQVEAVGKDVTRIQPGDAVYGEVNGETPGHAHLALGSCAEYVCVAADVLVAKPGNLTFEQAAAVPLAGMTALQGMRDHARVKSGQRVLINGASGGVGTFAVQIAKALGADVSGVCSTKNVELVRSLGASHVFDYTREDFSRSGQRFDVLLDLVGNRSLRACRRVLRPTGSYIASFGSPENRWLGPSAGLIAMALLSGFVSQRMFTFTAKRTVAALLDLKALIEDGRLTPVIDRTYALADVPDAMRHLATGHARGKIVITM